ncbi:MAG TPA: UvrD-helicase domain-containing protein, partial [Trueperaceae bacterium]
MRLTSEQQCAAQANTSVLVIAGAGTGKTHTLSHRYLHHLRCGLSPLQIVAVTFTDRAAAELRARVRQDLHEQRPDDTETPALLEAAHISTLHALAARVCRDHPDAAGVPADFAILEDLEGRVWLAETLDEVVAELPAKLFDHLPYHRCREVLGLLLEEPVLARHALAHGPQEWPAWVTEARTTALRNLLADAGWREAARLVRTSEGGEGDRIEDARRQAVDALDLLDRGDAASGLAALDRVNLQGGSKKAWPEGDLSSVKEALKLLRAHARASLKDGMVVLALGEADRRLAEALPAIRQAYEQVQGALDRAKRKRRVLDYADLERHALQALALPSVRQHYARRWKAILVDEFQDTNPVQEALLERLSENAILTVVGDDKQAIYGFRGAEAAVFRRARERICRAGGQDVVLRESFRSHHLLLDTINTTFRTVLGTQHQDLQARRRAAPHDGPHVQLLTIQPERGSNKSQRQVIEARAIAARLRTMLDDGTLVHDKRAGKLRPVQPSDMAVLTRTWAPLDTYGEILPSLGVPAVHTGGGNLLDTREAKDALALLRFLNDPRDDLALAAVLRSPFFACSDRELYQFAQTAIQDGTPCWWQALDDTPPDALAGAARTLKILHSQQPERPPSRLLQLADTLTGYTAVLANLPGAERRQADWGGFLELVRNFEQGSQDTFTLMRRLRSLLRAGIDVPRPNLQPGAAVTLMTIHRSK